MSPDEMDAYVKHLVDQAPPLSEAQRARIATLLRPAVEAQATAAVTPKQAPVPKRREAKAA